MRQTNPKDRIDRVTDYSVVRSSVTDPGNILVTAIVSTYNSEKFFNGCLEDLISQSLFVKGRMEILVVDSNSQQNEGELLKKFENQHSNITYLRTINREPLYTAWNRAIVASCGKYVTNANTDDRHHREAIEILAERLEHSPEFSLAYSDSIVTTTENQTFECCTVSKYLEYPDFDPIYQIHFGQCGPQPLWRRDLHDRYGWFSDGFKICADYEWWLRLCKREKFLHVPELLGLYLDSATSIEHREPAKSQAETDVIRNFYAASAGIKLDHNKYPNLALQDFYSRYSKQQYSKRKKLSIVINVAKLEDLHSAMSLLNSEMDTSDVELIVASSLSFNLSEELSDYRQKSVVRLVRVPEEASQSAKLGFAALHSSSPFISFFNFPLIFKSSQINSSLERIAYNALDVLILESDVTAGSCLSKAIVRADVFSPIRTLSSWGQLHEFMQLLESKIS